MPALTLPAARTSERHGAERPLDRVRWEELEGRLLFARGFTPTSLDADPDPPPADADSTVIVDRQGSEIRDEASQAPPTFNADSPVLSDDRPAATSDHATPSGRIPESREERRTTEEPTSVSLDDSPKAAEPSRTTETRGLESAGNARSLDRSAEPDDLPPDSNSSSAGTAHTRPVDSRTGDLSMEPIEPSTSDSQPARPVSRSIRTIEPVDTPSQPIERPVADPTSGPTTAPAQPDSQAPTDAEAAPRPHEQSPGCTPLRNARRSEIECATEQALALSAIAVEHASDLPVPAMADRTVPVAQVVLFDSPADQPVQVASTDSVARGDNEDESLPAAHSARNQPPDVLVGDGLTGALDGLPEGGGVQADAVPRAITAGVLAVALTRPVSRLTAASNLPLGEPSLATAIPPFVPRRRRRDLARTKPGTKDRPEDSDESDDNRPAIRPWECLAEIDAGIQARAGGSLRYEPHDAAIIMLLNDVGDDRAQESEPDWSPVRSMKSFAAGALTAAAAIFSLHGVRMSRRSRVQLKPAGPAYLGPTILAAN